MVLDALSCYMSIILKHFDPKTRYKKHCRSNFRGAHVTYLPQARPVGGPAAGLAGPGIPGPADTRGCSAGQASSAEFTLINQDFKCSQ